jgi:hypothetical protein
MTQTDLWVRSLDNSHGRNAYIIFKKTSVWKLNGHIKEGDH